ncbi:hypothetical protein SAMN05660484_00843 [Eubacterium ruminantium]|uniref:Uncharacterized protein n=1 Tax=Eubacterium ruminantium TaxID=42322 RepID=A0A1T4LSP3_9FIRM|nr:hypothetical protein [Eubacterium ruminantium]SCW39998.1 hypothetical protein SAMN05660484_00843 [Eubacterium ruminantium]SDM40680.1 hypothetical protein SAMN04490370_10357 [Eubacterium ruminantium]SJZ57651.1 hypothetical protein SAMN02745110_00909 [Eubacterium ruminantium]
MSVAKNDAEYCVTCPKCAKVIQKTFATDSFIKCPKCGFDYYSYVNDGVAISVDRSKYVSDNTRKTILLYARALTKLEKDHVLTD